jgi:predicted cupin superfamily sugar epimerase
MAAFATSYIKTEAATVTRNADAASMTEANFSSWYRADEGTFYSESVVGQIGVGSVTLAASDATASNRLQIQRTAGNNYQNLVVVGGVTQSSVSVSGVAANVSGKSADAFKLNDFNTAVNGVLGTADTSGTVPTVTQLEIGSRASSLFLNGHIRKVAYYPSSLTNAQLQALTS